MVDVKKLFDDFKKECLSDIASEEEKDSIVASYITLLTRR